MSAFGMQIFLGGMIVGLGFRTAERAVEAEAKIWTAVDRGDARVDLADDFGGSFAHRCDGIGGVLIIDEDAASELSVLRGLTQARANARAQKMAVTDPVLNGGIVPAREVILPGKRN